MRAAVRLGSAERSGPYGDAALAAISPGPGSNQGRRRRIRSPQPPRRARGARQKVRTSPPSAAITLHAPVPRSATTRRTYAQAAATASPTRREVRCSSAHPSSIRSRPFMSSEPPETVRARRATFPAVAHGAPSSGPASSLSFAVRRISLTRTSAARGRPLLPCTSSFASASTAHALADTGPFAGAVFARRRST